MRRHSRRIQVGSVAVGGDAPVSVQSMTTMRTPDIGATLQQIAELTFGIPEQFLAHGKRAEVLADAGLTPVEIAGRISAALAAGEAATRTEESGA